MRGCVRIVSIVIVEHYIIQVIINFVRAKLIPYCKVVDHELEYVA